MKPLINSIKQLDRETFERIFGNEEQCLKVLAEQKWGNGFRCRKCGHTNYCQGRSPYSRRCTRCKYEESACAFTIFHRCRIPLTLGFRILYDVCRDETISTYKLAQEYNLRQMTCWRFKKNIVECLEELKREHRTEASE
ncbi:MAG: transposase [Bacteroidales bacterium]|nr:transposase [Bacteroidales bacterium]MCF8332939.1 transposase [Bacteroidales bacterium]